MTAYSIGWRCVAILLGVVLAAVGATGAWEYAKALEGSVSYVVFAACLVGVAAAVLPAIAEWQARDGAYVKSALLWVAFFLCAGVVVTAVVERMHTAKAGGEAQRAALRSTASRAEANLASVKVKADEAKAEADKTKGWKVCGPKCEGVRASAERLSAEQAAAERALRTAEAAAVTESDLKQPPWILGIALWVSEVVLIWAGLTGPRPKKPAKKRAKGWWWQRHKPAPAVKRKRKARRKATTPPTPPPNNVVPIKAA